MGLRRSALGPLASAVVVTSAASSCALFLDPDDYVDPPSASSSPGGSGTGARGGDGGGGAGDCGAAAVGPRDPFLPGDAFALGNAPFTTITALASRPNGDTIAAGYCTGRGTIDFALGAGQEPCAFGAESVFVMALGSTLEPKWRLLASGTSANSHLYDVAAVTDGSDDVIVTGEVGQGLMLGDCDLAAIQVRDIFVARVGPGGQCRWRAKPDGPDTDAAHSVAVRGADVYVAGQFAAEVQFGDTKLVPMRSPEYFVAKLDTARGDWVWAKSLGGQAPPSTRAHVAIAEDGQSVWVAGTTSSDLLDCEVDMTAGAAGFVARVTAARGDPAASTCFTTSMDATSAPNIVQIGGIVADGSGAVVIGSPTGGGQTHADGKTIENGQVFVAHLTGDASVDWALSLKGAIHPQNPWSIAKTSTGHFVAAGSSYSAVVRTAGPSTGLDAYVVRLSPTGEPEWGERYGDAVTADQIIRAVDARGCGGAVVGGGFTSALTPIQLSAPRGLQQGFAAGLHP